MLSPTVPVLTNSSHKPEDTTVQIQTERDMSDGTRETFLGRPVKFHNVKGLYEEREKKHVYRGPSPGWACGRVLPSLAFLHEFQILHSSLMSA